jgi:hypothetical protein
LLWWRHHLDVQIWAETEPISNAGEDSNWHRLVDALEDVAEPVANPERFGNRVSCTLSPIG